MASTLMSAEGTCDHYSLSNAEENAQMEQWLSEKFSKEPDKVIIYSDPFDLVNHGMNLELRGVVIINDAEQPQ